MARQRGGAATGGGGPLVGGQTVNRPTDLQTLAPATGPLRAAIIAAVGAISLATAVGDLFIERDFHLASLYAIAVLVLGRLGSERLVYAGAISATVLTLIGHLARGDRNHAEDPGEAIATRAMACVLIWSTALIVARVIRETKRVARLGVALSSAEVELGRDRAVVEAANALAPIGVWSVGLDGHLEWSPEVGDVLGSGPEGPRREQIVNAAVEPDRSRLEATMRRAMLSGEPFREEVRIQRPDGERRWVVVMGERVLSKLGVARLRGTIQDITAWREAEQSAHVLSHRFAQFAAIMPIIIWTADPQGRIEYFNEALSRYAGNAEDELLGDEWVEAVDPRDLDRVKATWSRSIETGEPYDIEYRVRAASGNFEWHHLHAEAERAEDGTIVRWWGTSVNVNANRQLREQTFALAAEREAILESMTDGVGALDHNWVVTFMNGAAERIVQQTRDDVVGKPFWDLVSIPGMHPLRSALGEAMYQRRTSELELWSESLGKWLYITVSPSPMGVNCFFKDITEVKLMGERLAQAERLEAVGQLTGGIAHDFNNLLTVMLGGADSLRDEELPASAAATVDLIDSAARRGADLTNRLLSFSKRQPLQPRSVDLDARIAELQPLLARTLGAEVDLTIVPGAGAPPAEVDASQFDNALLNLAINARDAMPHGGQLTIEVLLATLDEHYAQTRPDVTPGSYVMVAVSDTGEGIAPEHLPRLFDPFFSTKGPGEGYGLGLATVWGFARQSGGHVAVYSEPGHGTTMKLFLPIAKEAADVTAPTPVAASRRGKGLVLVAEDDELVREFAVDQLRRHGYRVIEAGSGPEAIHACAADESGEELSLLFTDVMMPGGMTGRQLADAILASHPDTPVLYASGYTENVIVHNGRLDPDVQLLPKPYTAAQLLDRVAQLTGAQD